MALADQPPTRAVVNRENVIELVLNELPTSAIVVFDHDLRFVLVRGAAVADNGLSPADFEGRLAEESLPPGRFEFHKAMYEAALAGESTRREVSSPDGTRTYSLSCSPLRDAHGQIIGGVLSAMEISQLRASQKRAAENAARFQLAMESAPMGMASVSMDRIFLEVNDALCQMIGRSRKDLVGRPLSDIVHSADNDADMSVRANVLAGREKWAKSEKRLVRADGSEVWVNHLVGLVTGDNDEPISYVSQFVDITESRAKQFKLENLADTDPLTGLPHRGALDKTLGAWFPDAEGGQVAVLFLDLDDFKNLNDTHGHQAGDRALIAVAQRLQATVRKSDTLVRFGGDEFVLITRTPPAEIAELCRRLISSLADPVHLQDVSVKMTMSIGAAASRPGDDYDSVLWRADANVYQAKAAGGNHFVIDPA